jgi:hypothetical protein
MHLSSVGVPGRLFLLLHRLACVGWVVLKLLAESFQPWGFGEPSLYWRGRMSHLGLAMLATEALPKSLGRQPEVFHSES